jgi:predicted metal-dependent enzyme (double-stranded beta helix superfamily)
MTGTKGSYDLAAFVAAARKIVQPGGADPGPAGRQAIGALLRRLAHDPQILGRTGQTTARQGTHGLDIRGGEIHKEPDGTMALMLARFPHESETPIHTHNSWGVVCVVTGSDRYLAWRRIDDGAREGHAEVELVSEALLNPGDVVHFADVPEDIHSQQGANGAPVWELVFFGRDPNTAPRLYFDPRARTVTSRQALR